MVGCQITIIWQTTLPFNILGEDSFDLYFLILDLDFKLHLNVKHDMKDFVAFILSRKVTFKHFDC